LDFKPCIVHSRNEGFSNTWKKCLLKNNIELCFVNAKLYEYYINAATVFGKYVCQPGRKISNQQKWTLFAVTRNPHLEKAAFAPLTPFRFSRLNLVSKLKGGRSRGLFPYLDSKPSINHL
jgi:hypothetical protein